MASRQVDECCLDYWTQLVAKKRRKEAHLVQLRQAEAEAAAARAAKEKKAREADECRKAAVRAEHKRRFQEAEEAAGLGRHQRGPRALGGCATAGREGRRRSRVSKQPN